jgi:DNA-binding response OmpR family regulator
MSSDRVLLVEDDIVVSLELHEFLQDSGFTVEAAYSGDGAMASIKREAPWALVTDLDLGRGPDGFEVARYARVARPGLPVVFISGSMGARHPLEGVAGSGFVPKPFQGRQIAEALHRAMRITTV